MLFKYGGECSLVLLVLLVLFIVVELPFLRLQWKTLLFLVPLFSFWLNFLTFEAVSTSFTVAWLNPAPFRFLYLIFVLFVCTVGIMRFEFKTSCKLFKCLTSKPNHSGYIWNYLEKYLKLLFLSSSQEDMLFYYKFCIKSWVNTINL